MRRWVVVDPFCYKQFDPVSSAVHIPIAVEEFERTVNEAWQRYVLRDGYAPFCKHMILENFTSAPPGTMRICEENKTWLESGYESRTPKELAVLTRWFPKRYFPSLPPAKFLDIILYSKSQIQAENAAMNTADPNLETNYEYGIVGIKPQDEEFELPMQPITMYRNALGKDQGGSGQGIDREKYQESVEYWSQHAILK